jgi:multidrug resistance efflux pump
MFIHVPLTVLAPVTVVGRNAPAITAPLDAVVSEILVEPGQIVAQGDPVVAFEDTELRNALLIAEEDFSVAKAELERNMQASFVDPAASADVAVAQARLELARAQRDLAYDRFQNVTLRAPVGGRIVLDNPAEWIGQPVVVGERIMSVADQDDVVLEIHLSVSDAITLEDGARVRAFLDTDPLSPMDGTLYQQGFEPALTEDGTLAFPLRADLGDDETVHPRIGARGVAQIFGADQPLWYVLFRRPIVAIRQSFGI